MDYIKETTMELDGMVAKLERFKQFLDGAQQWGFLYPEQEEMEKLRYVIQALKTARKVIEGA